MPYITYTILFLISTVANTTTSTTENTTAATTIPIATIKGARVPLYSGARGARYPLIRRLIR